MLINPFEALREAMKGLPAMRYALGISALLALLAIGRSYGIDLRVAGFASLVFFVLLVPILLFSQLTESVSGPLKYPCLVMLWAAVILCIACWLCLFTSIFFHLPLDLSKWLLGSANQPSTVEISRPPPSVVPANPPIVETIRLPVVNVHIGGDDSKKDTFVYKAPSGFTIKSYKLIERTKGGDAAYSARLSTPSTLEIAWSVHSKTVRGPFRMVVNTITAFLGLDVEVTIQQRSIDPQLSTRDLTTVIQTNNRS